MASAPGHCCQGSRRYTCPPFLPGDPPREPAAAASGPSESPCTGCLPLWLGCQRDSCYENCSVGGLLCLLVQPFASIRSPGFEKLVPFPFLSPPSPSGEVGKVSAEKGAILGVSSAPSNLLSFCCHSLSTCTDRSLG